MPEVKGSDGISWHHTIKGEHSAKVKIINLLCLLKDWEMGELHLRLCNTLNTFSRGPEM